MSRSTAFGHADLAALDAAPGCAVQPHGLLLVVREPVLRIVQASTSAAAMLQRPLETLLLATLRDLGGDLDTRLRELLAAGPLREPRPLRCTVGAGDQGLGFEGAVHRVGVDAVVLELEPLAPGPGTAVEHPGGELMALLSTAVQDMSVASSLFGLAQAAACGMRALLGYDRVVVTEFGAGGDGRTVAESLAPGLARQPGGSLRLPRLSSRGGDSLLRQHVHVVVDVQAAAAALLPSLPPLGGAGFDLGQSYLRAPTPEHTRALRAQGACAWLLAALVREGRLWGVISCFHGEPRRLRYGLRAAVELLAEVFTTRLAAIESHARVQVAAEVRRLEQRLVEATSIEGDWRAALFRDPRALLQPLQASGALLCHEGEWLSCGAVPDDEGRRALLRWISTQPTANAAPFHCDALDRANPALARLNGTACGVLAVRLSAKGSDCVVWLRHEHEGSGAAPPWTSNDLALGAALGGALVDMILQVNAVRLLIAENQLTQLRAMVAGSRQAVVVAGAGQRAFHANAAFHALAGRCPGELADLDTLAALFANPALARAALGQVRAEQRHWRGELTLRRPDGALLPVAVRAEPVIARDRALLGCILIFDDQSDARRAETARAELEAELSRLGRTPHADQGQELIGAIVANAGLAAMDIAEGGAAPDAALLLHEVQASTVRATALLDCVRQFSGKPD